jgi:hypothetical protein
MKRAPFSSHREVKGGFLSQWLSLPCALAEALQQMARRPPPPQHPTEDKDDQQSTPHD